MSESTTPKFMKTADGFCYVYTDAISKLKHLTPYDGDVDARGMAVEAKEAPTPRQRTKKGAEPAVPQVDDTPADDTPADDTPED